MIKLRLYHRAPLEMRGSHLVPLNSMKDEWPDLYAQRTSKYTGREFVLDQRVPPLKCLWNDVLHFSPVHPRLIDEALRTAGFVYTPEKWFELDPEALGFSEANSCIFLHPFREDGDFKQRAEDFAPYSVEAIMKFQSVPPDTIRYYDRCRNAGTHPLLFCWIPHILYKGKIDTTKCNVIEA